MNKINKLLAIVALAFSSVAGAWQVDMDGCFAKAPMSYPDGAVGEYHVTIANQTVYIALQSPSWNLSDEAGNILVTGVFDDGHKTMVKFGPVANDRVVAAIDYTDVNKRRLMQSNSIDLVMDDGQSAITFTLFGFERLIPTLENCSSVKPLQTIRG